MPLSRGAPLRASGAVIVLMMAGCGAETTQPASMSATEVTLAFNALRAIDPASEGAYEAWLVDPSGQSRSLGRLAGGATTTFPVSGRIADGSQVRITLEPPGDTDALPSRQMMLRGTLHRGAADLTVVGAITEDALPLRVRPGQFTMFSPSDNALHGYPSNEESGIWLFNMQPAATDQRDMWVRLTQLDEGWTYEGWMVRDIGQEDAIWLSYGKFVPDFTGAINARDDSGWGPFSGVVNFRTLGEEEFPGDDWISNPLNLPFPKALSLPLNLRETDAGGGLRWTHVITIEPTWNRGEPIGSERPFVVRPYQDPFGNGAPGAPRTITFRPDNVPSGTARFR